MSMGKDIPLHAWALDLKITPRQKKQKFPLSGSAKPCLERPHNLSRAIMPQRISQIPEIKGYSKPVLALGYTCQLKTPRWPLIDKSTRLRGSIFQCNDPDQKPNPPGPETGQSGQEKATFGSYLWGILCFDSPDSTPSSIPNKEANITVTFRRIWTCIFKC